MADQETELDDVGAENKDWVLLLQLNACFNQFESELIWVERNLVYRNLVDMVERNHVDTG